MVTVVMRLRGIKKATAKGRTYYYHRATGQRIKAAFGTPDFAEEVRQLDQAGVAKKERPGTWGALVAEYRKSPEFTNKKPRTRRDYDKVFDWLGVDDMPIGSLAPSVVIGWRDKAFRQKKRRFANYVVQVVSLVCTWGIPREMIATNPAANVELIPRPGGTKKANRAWTDEERRVVLEHATGGLKRGIALAMFAALSRGDVVRWPWKGYTGSRIVGTRGKNDEPVNVLAHPELRELLDSWPRRGDIIVTNRAGKPYTENGFTQSFFNLIRRLEESGKVGPDLTLHGLRHTFGKVLGEVWGNSRGIARAIGDKTEEMGRHYSVEANLDAEVDRAMKRAERRLNTSLENRLENRRRRNS